LIVKDESTIHNLHIFGTGVDKTTGVPFVGRKVFKITTAGTYDIVCDRHSPMSTTLTVT
jgi:plastocyanin